MGLSSVEIEKICSPLKKTGRFLGCFPDDRIPLGSFNTPYGFIVNTDPSSKPGTHWVAVWVHSKTQAWYFDSLNGIPTSAMMQFLKNFKNVYANSRQYQSIFSEACGHFCITFIYYSNRYQSFEKIINIFNFPGSKIELFIKFFVQAIISGRKYL